MIIYVVDISILEASLDNEVLEYMKQTYASSTQKVYRTQKESYLAFCSVMGYTPVPASTPVLCRFAIILSRTLKYTTVKQYLNIIRLLHLEWDLPNPLEKNFQLQSLPKGMRRAMGDSPTCKIPINPSMLLKILSKLNLDTLEDSNMWASALIKFYAMLRRSNVLATKKSFNPTKHLCRNDFVFHHWGVMINIRWSKTIQFKDRTLYIPMPRIPGHPLCPVQAICHAFKFSAGACPGGPAFLRSQNQPLTPAHFVTRIRSCLDGNGVDVRQVAAHSFRRGGASWAYSVGLPIDTIRLIGDWKSQAYTAYVGSSTTLLLSAIKSVINNIFI